MSKRIFITAADPSGEQHAANLVRCLRQIMPDVIVEGLGGQRMKDAGVIVHHDTVGRAAMGWRAALRAKEVARLIRWTRSYFTKNTFDLQICVDSWTMNCHFAKLAKERDWPVMYFIAPQTWASREGRLKRMRKWVDRVACILPFEEEYFSRHGLRATFVGHPLFDELPADRRPLPAAERFPNRPPVIGLLPGSRRSIARANFPRFLDVAGQIRAIFPEAKFLVPTTSLTHPVVLDILSKTDGGQNLEVGLDAFDQFVPRCDLCLTVSGTAALHVAAYHVPLMVVYHGNPILWHLIGRWVVKTRTYSLVNLLSDFHDHIVPEFIPWYGSTRPVADYAIQMLQEPEKLETQKGKLAHMIAGLEKPGASMNAAKVAVEMMEMGENQ